MADRCGSFILILHAHIPYVLGHSTWPHGSQMLYEAAADTYMPLLQAIENLAAEGIPANVAISFSSVTLEQLADDRFKEWFSAYLSETRNVALQNQEEFRNRGDLHLEFLAGRWHDYYAHLSDKFCNEYQRDIIAAFRRQQDAGNIEIMTCAATHGYLPLLREDGSVQAQVTQAVTTYERFFGQRPRGCWLPECAYRPRARWAPPPEVSGVQIPYPRKGIEEFLGENGFDYFIVDTHMLSGGPAVPVRVEESATLGKLWNQIRRVDAPGDGIKTPYRPYFVGHYFEDHPAVAALIRDETTSLKVWSGTHGYPGDGNYLEFHKKHIPGDLRYWKVTGPGVDLGYKHPYYPDDAAQRAELHAGNFLWNVKTRLRHASCGDGPEPVLVAPFDAELFGHWWHEGPWWLEKTLRWMNQDPEVNVTTPHRYLAENTPTSAIALPEGSWGAGGGHHVWLNEETRWTWARIYDAETEMRQLLLDLGPGHDEAAASLIKQAARELLLLQASDWQFLITTASAADYTAARLDAHWSDFKKCTNMARRYSRGDWIDQHEWEEFGAICDRDRVFSDIDPLWFRDIRQPAT